MSNFPDHFSKQAKTYAQFRPGYPAQLFEFLATLTREHNLAWDCGTGNGQSAIHLANYFDQVIATDPSAEQIKNATPHPKIIYRTEKAEEPSLENSSVDIITVAQAIHWFDLNIFYAEVSRVLKPNGIIAAWTYTLPAITPEIDAAVLHFHNVIVDEFWQAPNRMVENEYRTLEFPFEKITTPDFFIEKEMSFDGLLGLLRSWSATQRYIDHYKNDPVEAYLQALQKAWGDPDEIKKTRWRIILKAGKVS